MKRYQVVYHLLILISLTHSAAASDQLAKNDREKKCQFPDPCGTTNSTEPLKLAKKGCEEKCGKVGIPFPFGIGVSCSLDKRYNVDCMNSSKPYLSAFENVEVLNISLQQQTITVKVLMTFDCQSQVLDGSQILISTINPGSNVISPFLFSRLHNIFVVEGCGNAVITDHGKTVAGCSTTCHNDTFVDRKKCYGMGCCQSTIPYYLKQFTLNLTGLDDGTCGPAFLVDKDLFVNRSSVNRPQSIDRDHYSVPISLFWPLTIDDIPVHERQECRRLKVRLNDGSFEDHIKCQCNVSAQGNPYLSNGCKKSEDCKQCEGWGAVCRSEVVGYNEDGTLLVVPKCDGIVVSYGGGVSLGGIIGVGVIIGLLILAVFSYSLHNIIKKTIDKRRKKKFFKRNGGLLLKQQQATYTGLVDKTILFTSKELDRATDHFNENRILGRGGQGTVYKGMLTDGRIVAIKKSKAVDESQIEQFINEIVILSQVIHRNVVKLLGCCLETEVPLLVSEFISNGTLYDLIQDESGEFPMSLNTRIQIAAEVAGALAYLHSATSTPIYHRDIKTTNILMDEKYRAKVSDFGTSRFVSIDQTHLTTKVKGTFGYLDPEYFQSSQFTEKSDVYSFGVVLLELLTREKPISLARFGEFRNLATHFIFAMEEGRVMSLFDPMVVNEGSSDELLAIANLASQCLNPNGKNRPTMNEVASDLEGMRMRRMPLTVQMSIEHSNYNEELTSKLEGMRLRRTTFTVQNSSEHTNYSEELPLFTYDKSTSTSFKDSITEI
uniref:wall-associated receptor kinase-like 1 n=1 Tax=Erigeron canadensis TaxID=72917 RepID=UPI001CB92A21|nr:wall-associated receptor kinase-like 1 [Erigeron canadensis]